MIVSPIARRREVRFEADIPLVFHLARGDSLSACITIDHSQNGLQLVTGLDIPLGSYVQIQVGHREKPKAEATYDLEARVIWRRDSTYLENHWTVGFLLLKRKDFASYQTVLGHHSQRPRVDQRNHNRRDPLIAGSTAHEQRRFGRRGVPSIKRRLMEQSFALDDWISTYRYQRILESASGTSVITQNSKRIMLGSNNYLGLTQHPRLKEAAIKAIEKYGVGAGSVRMLSGSMDLHQQLEERLAQFKGAEACVVLPSGYMANFAALTALLDTDDIVFNDELNHASIFDGCRATPAKIRIYRHNDIASLEKRLAQYDIDRLKLIVTDGVFSMDGDVAPLQDIIRLGKQYNAMVMVDDAHATGVIGSHGRGSAEHCGVTGQMDITVCTLSKALGGLGGAVCGSRQLIKTILNRVRAFIFTSALPPASVASAIAALDVIDSEPELLVNLHRNTRFLYQGLKELGYNVAETPSAILPVIIGEESKTNELAALLDDLGVFVSAVSPPAVPQRLCRLRVSVMATHTPDELEKALDCFKRAGRKLGVI